MCTISWLQHSDGYEIFFNRDEQKTRTIASPPKKIQVNGVNAIMPVDPQGGGTWCAVNQYGITIALLNFYQGRLPKGRLISRGQLVKECVAFRCLEDVKEYIDSLNLNKYAPFSLLFFVPSTSVSSMTMLRWDGKKMSLEQQESPLISSAFRFEEVQKSRLQSFQKLRQESEEEGEGLNSETLLGFHASHEPEASAYSVCMHRDDAHTVSFSHIKVAEGKIEYRYSDGAPCKNEVRSYGIMSLDTLDI